MDFAKQILLDVTRCSAWANRNLLDGCSALRPDELDRDLLISHASILSTLSHICDGERVWLDCLRTTANGRAWRLPPPPSPKYSFDQLRQIWPEIWNGFNLYLDAISEAELREVLIVQLPGEIEPRFPRWKILCHVMAHSTLHRGQVIGMIRMLGHQPPAINVMDYYLSK